jgi:hypothetical protein
MGGAIFNQGTVVIERSTLAGNTAEGGSAMSLGAGDAGGGIGTSSTPGAGGGMGPGIAMGGVGGSGFTTGGGGGAGFRVGENGRAGDALGNGSGGGAATGLGGAGGGATGPNAGDGSGGGGIDGANGHGSGNGGRFAQGGNFDVRGGGGGVGGGGGSSSGGPAGGGGFGGGGGACGNGGLAAGSGGFGGGGGANLACASDGPPGFGGGTPSGHQGGGGAGMGGAIFNMQGRVTIRESTLTQNAAFGGIDNVPDHAKGIGGAVFNLSGSFTADGSTFATNTAPYDGASIYNLVYDASTPRAAVTTLRDTIVADASGTDVASSKTAYIYPANLGSATVDAGQFDLVTAMAAREQGTITGSPLTADPLLGALRDNGGPTATMAPAPNSPAIDAGAAFGLATDQRGLPRPSDFGAVANAGDGSDIGAVESQAPGGSGSGSSSGGPRRAFGKRTLVTLRLGAKRIPARGPLRVVVVNANGFTISARLSGTTTGRPHLTLGPRSLRVKATARAIVKLALSKRLRTRFARTGLIAVRLRATVRDADGHSRTVSKTVVARKARRSR